MKNELVQFHEIGDERGSLVSLESLKNIPFEIKRVYYIYSTQDLARGFHAHRELQQMLICVSGSCNVILDDGDEKRNYILSNPSQGLFVDKMIWHEMNNLTSDCVLIVLASDHYNEEDYIRKYDDFIKKTKKISFSFYDKVFLNLSKIWLRDAEIKQLTMTPEFSDGAQLDWFYSLKNKSNYYIKGIKYRDKPIGAVGIKNINNYCGEYWGYIGEKQYWGKGLGRYLVLHATNYAKSLKLNYLYLKVDISNERAIKLYEKCGFKLQFIEENVMYMIKDIKY